MEPLPFGGEDAPWCLDGRGGVVYYPEGDKVCRYDVATGQREATAARLTDGWAQARFEEVVDGHLFLVRGKPGEEGYGRIALRLATGEVFRPDLEDGGQRVTIAAVMPQGYLVRLAGIPAADSEMRLSHYAMMDKTDYWNGRPNYREFTNPAYEAYSFEG